MYEWTVPILTYIDCTLVGIGIVLGSCIYSLRSLSIHWNLSKDLIITQSELDTKKLLKISYKLLTQTTAACLVLVPVALIRNSYLKLVAR